MTSLFLRINPSGPSSILIEDIGIQLEKSITDNEFSTQKELETLSTSKNLLDYCTDDLYGTNQSSILISYTNNGSAVETSSVESILINAVGNDQNLRINLEEAYNYAYNNHYTEFTYSGDNLTNVDIWETSGKIIKLFSRTLNYSGDNLTQITTIDEINNNTLTSTFSYSGDNLANITKIIT